MNWHERSKWLAVAAIALLLALPANALEVVSPVNGSVLSGPSVLVQYVTQSASCQATLNGAAIPLEGCRNFTMAALQGENVLSLWDGLESLEVRFTYGTGVAHSTVTPSGVIVRGRTAYTIPTAIVTPEGQAARETTDIRGLSGPHRLELRPIGSRIRNVVLEGVVLPQQADIGLEELSLTTVIDAGVVADAFAIDPTRVAFSNGTLTKTAVGNRVWKCALWDFDNRSCGGDWEMVLSVSPGLPYSVVFNATDPAYVETFDDSEAADIGVAALDNTTIVIAFIDSGSNDASFEVWNTNGVLLVDETDVDITVDGDSRVAVEAINTTHFIIGVLDGPEDDFDFYIYDRNGNQITGQTQIDPAANLNTDITLCQLGDRFATPWADDSDNDANYEIWNNNGAIIAAENQADIGIAPSSTNQNLVDCGALNNTHWGYSFFDDADNDITLAIVDNTGTITVTETDLDINVGETGQTASTGMRNDRVVVAFYDSTDDDITITIRGASGASLTTILANTDIDTNAGTNSRIATTEIENNGNSEFIVAWQDTSDNTIKASTYDNNGNQITTPYNITTTPSATRLLLDVAGYNSVIGTGLCNATFAIAYTNASGTAVFETYWRNGTRWNGVCGAPDTTPPVVTLIDPPDNTTNTTSNTIDFYFNVTDASDITNCTLYVDGLANTDLLNPARDTTLNITIQLDNGDYNWSVACYDVEGNWNQSETRNIGVDVPIMIAGADTRLTALDNTTIVIAFIDSGSNDASFEIWHTNGTRLLNTVDVDTTVDGDSRVAVEAINTTHFIIGVLDGPEDDFDFYIYDRNGNQITGQTQIDPAANLNTDITLCQLGDRFATPWADDSDNDANYEIWNNNGAIIAAENQADIGIAPSSTNQNLVDCGALNNTHWGYSFFDDADNDITLAIVDNTGTITVTETDLDINVGETGQTASTGMRNDRVVVAFYDSTDDDITITIRGASGASLTTILANTDIDTNAGTNSRIATTEIENNGNSEFIVAWQDTSDNTIKASTYDNNGNQITTPYNITTTPSASNLLFDVVGYNSNLGIGLCNATFAIAYTNSSGNTLFETYWRNGTRWDGRCGEPPDITAMSLPDPVVLNAGTTKLVECNLTTVDPDGAAHLVSANATLYHQTSSLSQPDDPGSHYTNASCTTAASSGAQRNYTCSFSLWYFALNGTWYCDAAVQDVHKNIDFEVANTTIDPLYALNVTETFLDFGDLETGQASANLTENVTNVGNMPINVSVLGYGSTLGDAYAFACAADNLNVDVLRFAPNSTAGYAAKEALSGVYVPLRIGIPRQVSVGDPPQNISYWQTRIPDNTSFVGQCNGTVVFQADAS